MSRRLLHPIFVGLIAGCANAPPAPPSIPVAWSQTPDERGALPVGRVVEIERRYGPAMVAVESSGLEQMRDGFLSMAIPPLVLITAPVVLVGVGLGVVDEKPSNENGNVYRHLVRLTGTNEEIVRDEYWTYKVGDCVAVRSEPILLVPALPDECL